MPFLENEIRKLADIPTNRMVDLWHDVCNSTLNRPLEVVVENRWKHPRLSSSRHEVNTAFPAGYKGKVVLSVWVESFPDLKPILISHEVGHWVLNLQGFGVCFTILDTLRPAIFDESVIDEKHYVKLEDAEETARLLAAKEGIFCGPSSGAILHVALQRAKEVDGGVMVVVAPDGGEKYLSTELCDEEKCIECFEKYGIS